MTPIELLTLATAGVVAGVLAGFLGIGGGTVLVPLLLTLGCEPVQAIATSALSIVITASSGSIQNWRMGYLNFKQVLGIGLPALLTAQIGAFLADKFPKHWLLVAFGLLLLSNIYLVEVRKRITARKKIEEEGVENIEAAPNNNNHQSQKNRDIISRIATGSAAGLLAGLFGVGGGVIMVPLQILLLDETIKRAIQTSLGVIVITAISATAGHAIRGNVLWKYGLILGFGGLLGAQFSTRFLPKLPDKVVSLAFRGLLALLSVYIFWKAWESFQELTINN
jgi:uncharacterized membrane protein YfcA